MNIVTLTWDELRVRRGNFSIPKSFMITDLDTVHKIMSHVVVVRCEYRYFSDDFYYDAFCELFKPLEAKSQEPLYEYDIGENGDLIWYIVE